MKNVPVAFEELAYLLIKIEIMRRFFIIAIGYTRSKSIRAVNLCNRIALNLCLQGYETKKVFIDNSPGGECCPQGRWSTVIGSNKFAEFSGYQEGLDHIRASYALTDSDVCLFVNDTVNSHRNFGFDRELHLAYLLTKLPEGSLGGYIESHGLSGFTIDSKSITAWVSTFAFALDVKALSKLGYRIEHRNLLEDMSVDCISQTITTGYPISDPLSRHILTWLSENWYGAKPIHLWEPEKLKLKAACILNEKLLSISCAEHSIKVIDFQASYAQFQAHFTYLIRSKEFFKKLIKRFIVLPYRRILYSVYSSSKAQ